MRFEDKILNFLQLVQQEDLMRMYLLRMLEVIINNGYIRVELRIGLFPIKRRNMIDIMNGP
jgi:hypothetical protein